MFYVMLVYKAIRIWRNFDLIKLFIYLRRRLNVFLKILNLIFTKLFVIIPTMHSVYWATIMISDCHRMRTWCDLWTFFNTVLNVAETQLWYTFNDIFIVNMYCMCLHSSVQNSLCLSILNMCTVKPVLIGHHWDKEKVVS